MACSPNIPDRELISIFWLIPAVPRPPRGAVVVKASPAEALTAEQLTRCGGTR